MENSTFIKKINTEQTGGGIMVDFIELANGKIIAISDDAIGIYKNMEDYEAGKALKMDYNEE